MLGDPRFRFFIEHIFRPLLHDSTAIWKPGGEEVGVECLNAYGRFFFYPTPSPSPL
jgi:hypothetical protein